MARTLLQKLASLWPLRNWGCLPQLQRDERYSLIAAENEANTLDRPLRLRAVRVPEEASGEGAGSSKLQGLPPELVHRVLVSTTPSDCTFASLSASCRQCTRSCSSPGPLWDSWLQTFFGKDAAQRAAQVGTDPLEVFRDIVSKKSGGWQARAAAAGPSPSGREKFAFVQAPSAGGSTVTALVHGGLDMAMGAVCNDLWKLELDCRATCPSDAKWNQVDTTGQKPCERCDHDACIIGDGHLLVHGGLHPEGYRDNDSFLLDLHKAPPRWMEISPGNVHDQRRPTPRFHHTFTPLNDGERVVLFGGHNRRIMPVKGLSLLTVQKHCDIWESALAWDIEVDNRTDHGPEARARHAAAPAGSSSMVVFGGETLRFMNVGQRWLVIPRQDLKNDAWIFTGMGWAQLSPSQGELPCPRKDCRCLVTSCGRLVVAGGFVDADEMVWTLDISTCLSIVNGPGALEEVLATPAWQRVQVSGPWPGPTLPVVFHAVGHLFILGGHSLPSRSSENFGDPQTLAEEPTDPSGSLARYADPVDENHAIMRGFRTATAIHHQHWHGKRWVCMAGGTGGGTSLDSITAPAADGTLGVKVTGVLPLHGSCGGVQCLALACGDEHYKPDMGLAPYVLRVSS